jgi:opacity protein-like surface antigen
MKRFACVAAVCLVATLGVGAVSAQAQTTSSGPDPKRYVEINFGPTLGHKSDKFVGGEAGLRVAEGLYVIIEASHMGNVATTDLDDRATIIANYLAGQTDTAAVGTATTAFKVNHLAAGLRYNINYLPMVHPYILGAVGIAHVKTEVAFSVNGTVIDPASQVQLGSDLSGTLNKTMIVVGFGVNVPFATRFFADLGYRYGRILAKTGNFETDTSIPTQRVVLGVGVRF